MASGTDSASDSNRDKSARYPCLIGLVVFILIAGAGTVLTWLLVEPVIIVGGKIHIAPTTSNMLTGEREGVIQDYPAYINTQAEMVTSSRVVERVADDLADKNMELLAGNTDPAAVLKQAIADDVIGATAVTGTELISVTMKTKAPDEAMMIIDSFIRNYVDIQRTISSSEEVSRLNVLADRRDILETKMQMQRTQISELAAEYGPKKLSPSGDLKLRRVGSLLDELARLQGRRLDLEVKAKVLEDSSPADPNLLWQMRQEYVCCDPLIQALAERVADIEVDYVGAHLDKSGEEAELQNAKRLLDALREQLGRRKAEVTQEFNQRAIQQKAISDSCELAQVRKELEQVMAREQQTRTTLEKEDTATIGVGRTQIVIQSLEEKHALTKEMWDTVNRRIGVLEIQQSVPGRVSVADPAQVIDIRDDRYALTGAAVLCGLILSTAVWLLGRRRGRNAQ